MRVKQPPSRGHRWIPLRWDPRSDLPKTARLLARIALLVLLVAAGDRVTVFMTHQEWVLSHHAVIAVRLFTALPILRYPFEGFVMALEVDKWDWYWLAAGSQSEAVQTAYQKWDKVIDLFPFAIGLVVSLRWPDLTMRRLLAGTFTLRIIGVAAFLLTRQRWLLVVFPNVFENLFLMYVVFRLVSGRGQMLVGRRSTLLVVLIAVVPKLVEEYFIHMLDRRPWDWVNLPLPDGIEPRVWIVAMYLPALVTVLLLAWRRADQAADGDRADQG